jgi:hypothetical protein
MISNVVVNLSIWSRYIAVSVNREHVVPFSMTPSLLGLPSGQLQAYYPVIYLDWRLFGAADWRLFVLAVDPPILQPAWRGFEAVERLKRRIYT